jgi:hypothetical protein
MKNVQIIDGSQNSVFEIYEVSDDLFAVIFPGDTDVAFLDDIERHIQKKFGDSFWDEFYRVRVDKKDVMGIQGTLHITGSCCKKECFPTLREEEVIQNRIF